MTHWKIKDLKGVGDVELELDDSKRVFVFFGSNGVGKTKTLEALFLVLLLQTQAFKFEDYNLLDDTRLPKKSLKKLFEKVDLSKQTFVLNEDDNRFNLIDYHKFYDQEAEKKFSALSFIGVNARNSVASNHYFEDYHKTSFGGFDTRQSNFFEILSHVIRTNDFASLGMNQSIYTWFIERAQSVNPYQKLEDNRQIDIDAVLNALHKLDNRFEKKLNIDGDDNVYLTIEGQERELSELSSGFISVVKIIQSIISAYSAFTNSQDLLNVKGVVLIDEIESHLHVEWQTKIIPTLKDLFPNTTFYIATHSPLVLSQLHEGEAYLLRRDEDGVVRSEMIDSPNKRILQSVLIDAFNIDLNKLKREGMADSDQTLAKKRLLDLLGDD